MKGMKQDIFSFLKSKQFDVVFLQGHISSLKIIMIRAQAGVDLLLILK